MRYWYQLKQATQIQGREVIEPPSRCDRAKRSNAISSLVGVASLLPSSPGAAGTTVAHIADAYLTGLGVTLMAQARVKEILILSPTETLSRFAGLLTLTTL